MLRQTTPSKTRWAQKQSETKQKETNTMTLRLRIHQTPSLQHGIQMFDVEVRETNTSIANQQTDNNSITPMKNDKANGRGDETSGKRVRIEKAK